MADESSRDALTRPYANSCAVMAAVFALSAAVQWNDPDPLAWIAFYSLATAAAIAAWLRARSELAVEVLLALLALAVVVSLLPALGDARVEAVTSIEMKSPEDEEVRELGGAAIVLAFASLLLARRVWRS